MIGGSLFAGLPTATQPIPPVEYTGTKVIELVENRANEVSVPVVRDAAISTRLMEWDDAQNRFVASVNPTRISEFVKQVNKRILGSAAMVPTVITRCESVDGDTGNRLVFTPGATVVGSLQDFEVIIPDQRGGYEARGFLIYLANDANPNPSIDGGSVLVRLVPSAFPWT